MIIKRGILNLIFVFLLVSFFAVLNLFYPRYLNLAIEFINQKVNVVSIKKVPPKEYVLGYEFEGGTRLLYRIVFSPKNTLIIIDGLRELVFNRLNLAGFSDFSVDVWQKQGYYEVSIEAKGENLNIVDAYRAVETLPAFEMREQRSEEESQRILDKREELQGKSYEEAQQVEDWELAFQDPYYQSTGLDGRYVEAINYVVDPGTMKPIIIIKFDSEGTEFFKNLTERNIDKSMALYADNFLVSSFKIGQRVTEGVIQISGVNSRQGEILAGSLAAVTFWDKAELLSEENITKVQAHRSASNLTFFAIVFVFLLFLFLLFSFRFLGIICFFEFLFWILSSAVWIKFAGIKIGFFSVFGFVFSLLFFFGAHFAVFWQAKKELKEEKVFLNKVFPQAFKKTFPIMMAMFFAALFSLLVLPFVQSDYAYDISKTLSAGLILNILFLGLALPVFAAFFQEKTGDKLKRFWA